ncbi:MAG: ATP-binding cassette domain-containing protein [Prolixibacteraceae bacterium]|nr:ATP-binding cassette domain-containing protein [Prolixibacteraceae bacterium]
MKKLIEIKNLSVRYDDHLVLKNVNLSIDEFDFLGVIGPNGGGKSTLVKAIMKIIKPSEGEILYHIPFSKVGYLPQINQIDHRFPIKVIDVVRSGKADILTRNPFKKNKEEIRQAEELLEDMGIANLKDKSIGGLSGGQLQRVFLCRSLIKNPSLLVLDEPDAFVDNRFESLLYEQLKKLNKKMAILLISHDIGTIAFYVKNIACVNVNVFYHQGNKISQEQLDDYDCPLKLISHGKIPHTVLKFHE